MDEKLKHPTDPRGPDQLLFVYGHSLQRPDNSKKKKKKNPDLENPITIDISKI